MQQSLLHYGMHFGMPLLIAFIYFNKDWKMAYVLMMMGMLIDFDHLLANPIYDPNRCSIGMHPLHTYYAMGVYAILAVLKKTRLIGLGLCIHIIADFADCAMMTS